MTKEDLVLGYKGTDYQCEFERRGLGRKVLATLSEIFSKSDIKVLLPSERQKKILSALGRAASFIGRNLQEGIIYIDAYFKSQSLDSEKSEKAKRFLAGQINEDEYLRNGR